MPEIESQTITRAWRFSDEPDRIRFVVVRPDGTDRQLFANPGDPLHAGLAAHLRQQGYEPPGRNVPRSDAMDLGRDHPEQGR